MSIESEMPSNHLILCRPLLLLPSIFPSIRVFSRELALRIRCFTILGYIYIYSLYSLIYPRRINAFELWFWRRLYTWTSPDGQQWNQIDYILCSQRWRSSIQSTKIRQGADCGSDHELLIAKFRSKLKKVGKTTRPFRYDLNQIPYDYTVEVRNRFKGLDLIDRVPDELWMEVHDIIQ